MDRLAGEEHEQAAPSLRFWLSLSDLVRALLFYFRPCYVSLFFFVWGVVIKKMLFITRMVWYQRREICDGTLSYRAD